MDQRKKCRRLWRRIVLLDYVHPALNCEITAIGGYYIFLKEVTLPYQVRPIYYLVGCAIFNSTCCGSGGVSFVRVPGFVHRYKYKTGPAGDQVSLIEPVSGTLRQKKIQQIIQQREMVYQVEFG
jgi:hypothetical protein